MFTPWGVVAIYTAESGKHKKIKTSHAIVFKQAMTDASNKVVLFGEDGPQVYPQVDE